MPDLTIELTSDRKTLRADDTIELRYLVRNVCAVPLHWLSESPRFRYQAPETVAITLGLVKRSPLERFYAFIPPETSVLPPGEAAQGLIPLTLPLRRPTLDLATWSSGTVEGPPPGPVTVTLAVGHARSPMPLYPEPDLERILAWQKVATSPPLYLELLP